MVFESHSCILFPISRNPPEGGTPCIIRSIYRQLDLDSFQFLGIPPKGERPSSWGTCQQKSKFPISRNPPEGGTTVVSTTGTTLLANGRFQFLGIPPKGEP